MAKKYKKSDWWNDYLKDKASGKFTGDFATYTHGKFDKRGVKAQSHYIQKPGKLSGDATNWFAVAQDLYGYEAGDKFNAQRMAAIRRGSLLQA